MSTITGECFCGDMQYSFEGPVKPATSCHCSRCRKAFSGASSAMSSVADCNFTWTAGETNLSTYINKEGLGLGFCKKCGSTLVGIYNGKVAGVTLGTLNENPKVEISQHIFVGSKSSWDHIGGNAPQFEEWAKK